MNDNTIQGEIIRPFSPAIGKYNINDYQGDLFKRKNEPNPVFFNELKNLISHFIWNWDEYLKKYRIKF